MIDREYPVVGSENIQTAGKDKPEPSLGGAEALLFDPICNPYHKCVGEEGIAKTLDRISDKEDRPVHIGNADTGEACDSEGIEKEACEHGLFYSEGLSDNSGEPCGNRYCDAIDREKVSGIESLFSDVSAEPGLLDAVTHHEDQYSQESPGKALREPCLLEYIGHSVSV